LTGADSVVVERGDTLWSIAASVAGEDDVRAVVDRIQQLNGLAGSTVVPGQVLEMP
jgi:nucleoid-associated protein YgaU